MRQFWRRAWRLARWRRFEVDLAEEMAFHREMSERGHREDGLVPEQADRAAKRTFGSSALARDQARDVWISPWAQSLPQDVRFAVRLLAKDRWVTCAAVVALALGIGVGNTFFIVINAVCLRGLPIDAADRVLYVSARDARGSELGVSHPDFQDMQATRAFSGIAAFTSAPFVVGDEGRAPDRVNGVYISATAFQLLREEPLLGRSFSNDDDKPGSPAVVVLGGGVWKTRYGTDPTMIGRTIRVNGIPSIVVGVMREGFRFPNNADLWQPLALAPGLTSQPRDLRTFAVFGRLRDGATLAQVRSELNSIAERQASDHPNTNKGIRPGVVPINERYNARITDPVWLAFITAGLLVLLVSCSNVANLLLVRAAHRSREIAIRASLGATRQRIVRQLLVESVVLAALGGLAGLGLSIMGARLLSMSLTENAPYWIQFTMDARGFIVLGGVCLATAAVFGLAPALHISKTDVHEMLQEGGRGGTSGLRARRWTAAFLTVEFGLTMVLLAAVALGFRNFQALQRADDVIDASNLLTMWISLPAQTYQTPEQRLAFFQNLSERLDGIPGVSSTAAASALPFSGSAIAGLTIDGRSSASGETSPTVSVVFIGEHYFEALGLTLRRGRGFVPTDGMAGHESAVVNERLATMYFPDEDPIGHHIRVRPPNGPESAAWLTIVGVAPTVRQRAQGAAADPVVYRPFRESSTATAAFLVKGSSRPTALASIVREELRALDPESPMYRVMAMDQVISQARLNGRVSQALVTIIAGIALGLSALGIYAVTAHAVAQRTREIGIRIALGARPRQITSLVLERAMWQLLCGLLAGIGCTAAWERLFSESSDGRLLSPVTYRMTDPLVLTLTGVLITIVALTACLWPARRATRLDPIAALRFE